MFRRKTDLCTLLSVDDERCTSSDDDGDTHETTPEEAEAAVKLQSVWRGRKVREENKKRGVEGVTIADANSLSVNKRKEARRKAGASVYSLTRLYVCST